MKRIATGLFFLVVALTSCKHNKKANIVGSWRAVKLQNAEMDSFFTNSQAYIDTVGKNNTAAKNIEFYGVANMDSMRQVLQLQYDSAKALQMNAILNTVFQFRSDSVALLTFNGSVDSSRWYYDGSNSLVLSDLNGVKQGDKVKMEVLDLSDTLLKLKFIENNASSTVTFHPEGM